MLILNFLRAVCLFPIGLAYVIVVEVMRVLSRDKVQLSTQVISIGNLTLGGAGKTPFLLLCAEVLKSKGLTPVLVHGSYKARLKSSRRVQSKDLSADVGDEALMTATKLPNLGVYSGPSKSETALLANRDHPKSVILVDDGFQHFRLQRNRDFVLLDVTRPIWHLLPFPAGFARENPWALKRSSVIVLSNWNLATEGQRSIYERVARYFDKPVLHSSVRLTGIRLMNHEQVRDNVQTRPVLMVSGIARPDGFLAVLKEAGFGRIVGRKDLGDHSEFSEAKMQEIEMLADRTGAEVIVTTEKDEVRLKNLRLKKPIWVVEIRSVVPELDRVLSKD